MSTLLRSHSICSSTPAADDCLQRNPDPPPRRQLEKRPFFYTNSAAHLTRGVFGAKTKGARACWGLQGRGRGGSALASGKCSCLWLRACSLARSREVLCWCYPACSGAGARRGARTLGSIRARDAWHRLVRSERDPRRSEAQTRTREVRAAAVLPSELSYEGCQPRSFPAGCFRNPQRSSLRSTKRAPRRRQSRTRECGQSKGRRQQIQSLSRRRYRKVCALSI